MSLPTIARLVLAATLAALAFTAVEPAADARPHRPYHRRHHHRPHRSHGHVGFLFLPPGVYTGVGLVGTHILDQRGGPELLGDGAGLTLFTGIRIGNSLALELGWLGSLHNPKTVETPWGREVDYLALGAITADARVYLGGTNPDGTVSALRPYVQGGVGVYILDRERLGTEAAGTGFQLGGGFDVALGSNVDLGVRALYRGIAMGTSSQDDATYISAVTAEGSLSVKF